MEGSLVLTIHMYELRETVFAGRDPGLIPCFGLRDRAGQVEARDQDRRPAHRHVHRRRDRDQRRGDHRAVDRVQRRAQQHR